MYAFALEKPPSLVGRNFCLAIVRVFAKAPSLLFRGLQGGFDGRGLFEFPEGMVEDLQQFEILFRKHYGVADDRVVEDAQAGFG
jgi:hypothetical protein